MKKKLLTENIANELEGASLFFTRRTTPPPSNEKPVTRQSITITESPVSIEPTVNESALEPSKKAEVQKEQKINRDTMTPRHHDTTVSRYHDTMKPSIYGVEVELVRKAVKEFGKEAATHRFTEAEKKQIADLIYTYNNRGLKTNENEITRIAVNFVMQDFKENGENSVLDKILKALKG